MTAAEAINGNRGRLLQNDFDVQRVAILDAGDLGGCEAVFEIVGVRIG